MRSNNLCIRFMGKEKPVICHWNNKLCAEEENSNMGIPTLEISKI